MESDNREKTEGMKDEIIEIFKEHSTDVDNFNSALFESEYEDIAEIIIKLFNHSKLQVPSDDFICTQANEIAKIFWGTEHLSCFGNFEVKMQSIIIDLFKSHLTEQPKEGEASDVNILIEGLKTIRGLGKQTGKAGERFLSDIAKETILKYNKSHLEQQLKQ